MLCKNVKNFYYKYFIHKNFKNFNFEMKNCKKSLNLNFHILASENNPRPIIMNFGRNTLNGVKFGRTLNSEL